MHVIISKTSVKFYKFLLSEIGSPRSLRLVTRTASSLKIRWNEPSIGGKANSIIRYRVTWNSGILDPGNSRLANITNLRSNRFYTLNVFAQANNGEISEISSITTATGIRIDIVFLHKH